MSDYILNPYATVTIGFQGLAVCCFNPTFNYGRGRWEIAIPRFADHKLEIEIVGVGVIIVDEDVRIIEVKDRVGVATIPKHEVEPFDSAMTRAQIGMIFVGLPILRIALRYRTEESQS